MNPREMYAVLTGTLLAEHCREYNQCVSRLLFVWGMTEISDGESIFVDRWHIRDNCRKSNAKKSVGYLLKHVLPFFIFFVEKLFVTLGLD